MQLATIAVVDGPAAIFCDRQLNVPLQNAWLLATGKHAVATNQQNEHWSSGPAATDSHV